MFLKQFILLQRGAVNQVYGMMPVDWDYDNVDDFHRKFSAKFREILRHDHEKNVVGRKENPSKSPLEDRYFYQPWMEKQQLAKAVAKEPVNRGSYLIVDTFMCMGTRFGLKDLLCFVEVCQTDCGGARMWANIYMVYDSIVPDCVIETLQYDVKLDPNWVKATLAKDEANEKRWNERSATLEALEAKALLETT